MASGTCRAGKGVSWASLVMHHPNEVDTTSHTAPWSGNWTDPGGPGGQPGAVRQLPACGNFDTHSILATVTLMKSPLHPLSLSNCCDPRQLFSSGLLVSSHTRLHTASRHDRPQCHDSLHILPHLESGGWRSASRVHLKGRVQCGPGKVHSTWDSTWRMERAALLY